MADSELVVRINGDIKQYKKALEQASKGTKEFNKELTKIAKISAVAFTASSTALAVFTNEFRKFEKALIGVGKTTGLAGEDLQFFGNEIQNLSKRIPVAATQLLDIAQSAGQLGVKGSANLLKFTETIAKLGTASDLQGEFAAKTLTRILTITREGVGDIDKFASVIVRLGNNFAATESEIAAATAETARALSIFNVASTEAAALGTAAKSLGINTELLGTTFGQTFRKIDKALREGGANMALLEKITGKTGKKLKKQFGKDATVVFQQFLKGLNNVKASGGDVTKELEAMGLSGERINKVIPTMAENYDLLDRTLRQARDEQKKVTALNKEAASAFDALDADLKTATGSVTAFAVEVGSKFAPILRAALSVLNGFFDILSNNPILAETSALLIGAAVAATGLTTAIAVGTLVFVKYRNIMATSAVATKTLTLSMRTLMGATGIGLILTIAPLAIDLIKQMGGEIKKTSKAEFETKSAEDLGATMIDLRKKIIKTTLKIDELKKIGASASKDGIRGKEAEIKASQKKLDALNAEKGKILEIFKERKQAEDKRVAEDKARREKEKSEKTQSISDELQSVRDKNKELVEQQKTFEAERSEIVRLNKENEIIAKEEHTARLVELQNNENLLMQEIEAEENDRKAEAELERQKKFLSDRKKHGETVAKLNRFLGSQEVKETQMITSKLVGMQNSKNQMLQTIGKAAAITQIGITTARDASEIFGRLNALFPIAAPAIGAAGAAAISAYGVEQISNVKGAKDGALVDGGISGKDSVPFMLAPGELVVPKKNFEDVVRGYVSQQGGTVQPQEAPSPEKDIKITLDLDTDKIIEIVEVKLNERSINNVSSL